MVIFSPFVRFRCNSRTGWTETRSVAVILGQSATNCRDDIEPRIEETYKSKTKGNKGFNALFMSSIPSNTVCWRSPRCSICLMNRQRPVVIRLRWHIGRWSHCSGHWTPEFARSSHRQLAPTGPSRRSEQRTIKKRQGGTSLEAVQWGNYSPW